MHVPVCAPSHPKSNGPREPKCLARARALARTDPTKIKCAAAYATWEVREDLGTKKIGDPTIHCQSSIQSSTFHPSRRLGAVVHLWVPPAPRQPALHHLLLNCSFFVPPTPFATSAAHPRVCHKPTRCFWRPTRYPNPILTDESSH
jgi:hypothetical protein